MGSIFFEVTIVICLAAFLSILFKIIKQPPILAYIATGVIIGPLALFRIQNLAVLQDFSQFGITLLLFLFGLELRFADFASIGKAALAAGISQVVLTFLGAFYIANFLGFSTVSDIYIGLAISFSSTVILIKLLSDKKDVRSLYGKIAIGISLVQDFVAILVLILLSGGVSLVDTSFISLDLAILFLKSIILFTTIIWLGKIVLPKVVHIIARSQEVLFLFSLAWVFGTSALVSSHFVGFSIEIGGFVAGLALANATENLQIVAKLRPLRDFFVTIFFVYLGIEMGVGNPENIILPAIILSVFALAAKPFIVMFSLGLLGYRKRTAFFSGTSIAQLSEFSLILVVLGNKLGQIPNNIVSLVTAVAIVTFIVATYGIRNNNKIFIFLDKYLPWVNFGRKLELLAIDGDDYRDHIVLVGLHDMGLSLLNALQGTGDKIVVVDFDPTVVEKMKKRQVPLVFGDIVDIDIQERAKIAKAKLVISTLSDLEDNIILIRAVHLANKKGKVVVMAYDMDDANLLYYEGADYVVLPHLAGGSQIVRTVKSNALDKLGELREKDKIFLQQE